MLARRLFFCVLNLNVTYIITSSLMAIPEIQIPTDDIYDAIDDDSFCIFIGAGVSRLLGCSSWDQLCISIIDECNLKGWLSNPVRDEYVKDSDKKRVLNICYYKFVRNKEKHRYFEIIRESCEGKEELRLNYNIYDELIKIPSKYVTTNFDLLFSNKFHDRDVIYKNEAFNPENIQREVLYQIHGSINEDESIVLTTSNYAYKYNVTNYLAFLQKLFSDNLILFIGYGLSEMEILIPLFNKVISANPRKNYALRGYNDEKMIYLQDDIDHYSSLGITLLPFNIENKGYNLLFDNMAYWNKEIKQNCDVIFKDLNQIERLVR